MCDATEMGKGHSPGLVLVSPVLNDWESLRLLLDEISKLTAIQEIQIAVCVVDDGSLETWMPTDEDLSPVIFEIQLISLHANQGHQRAIAIGLSIAFEHYPESPVIVLDSDGEDRPEDIPKLIQAASLNPGNIVVAKRVQRSESLFFRVFYFLYKQLFHMLTGQAISFGNFSYIPSRRVSNVIFNAGIWNNFAATLMKSRIPITHVSTSRGKRYFGASKMNFTSLMLHGMSAISVFTDVVVGRIIVFLAFVFVSIFGAIVGIATMRIVLGLFVPGYATNLIMFLVNVLALTIFIGFMVILLLLAQRSSAAASLSFMAQTLVRSIHTINRR